jgi:cation diffusion facilitator family transporter
MDPTIATTSRGIWAIKWSFVLLMITSVLQMVIVAFSGSVALLADTIHNIGDAATAIPLWIAFMFARRKPSARFTYGLGRVEDLAGVAIVGIILFSAIVAGYQAIERLINPEPIAFLAWVAGAGVVGFIGNEAVAVFRIRVGREINSAALVADGYHARVDGLTSLAVVVGAVGVWLGFPLADPIVGLIITAMIFGIVWQSARSVFTRMLDGVEPEMLTGLRHSAEHVPGVRGVENVRARWMGHRLYAEADIVLDPSACVQAARAAAEAFRREAMAHMPALESLHVGVASGVAAGEPLAHSHGHAHPHAHAHRDSDVRMIDTGHGLHVLELHHHDEWSRWRFRPERGKPWGAREVTLVTERADGRQQAFTFVERDGFIESLEAVPEPHRFAIKLALGHGDHSHGLEFSFAAGEARSELVSRRS